MKQCPSCGGDCGRTKNSGCRYVLSADMDIEQEQRITDLAYDKWGTEGTPLREKMAWHDGFAAALKLIKER